MATWGRLQQWVSPCGGVASAVATSCLFLNSVSRHLRGNHCNSASLLLFESVSPWVSVTSCHWITSELKSTWLQETPSSASLLYKSLKADSKRHMVWLLQTQLRLDFTALLWRSLTARPRCLPGRSEVVRRWHTCSPNSGSTADSTRLQKQDGSS